MTEVFSPVTTPTVEGITRQNLIKRFFDRTGFGIAGTVDSGSATTLVDDALIGRGNHIKSFVGGFVRIVQAGAASPEGKIRPITAFDPATGTVTFPTVTDTLAANDEYEIWRPVLHPQQVLNWIDEILTEQIYLPCWTMLTEVPDGDMEQTHITDWTASNATVTKATSDRDFFGRRCLSVEATSNDGYARSALIQVKPGKGYHASVISRPGTSSAKFQVWDETNSAEIKSITSTDLFGKRLVIEFNAPGTCKTVSLRLITPVSGETNKWDEACFYSLETNELPLPWWVKKGSQVWRVFKLSPHTLESGMWDSSLRGDHAADWEVQDTYHSGGQLKVVNRRPGLTAPLYIVGGRNELAYANDYTEAKYINPDMLLACLLYKSYEYLSSQYIAGQQDTAAFQQKSRYWQATYKSIMYQDWMKIQQYFTGPKTNEAVLDGRFAFRV